MKKPICKDNRGLTLVELLVGHFRNGESCRQRHQRAEQSRKK